MSDHATVVAAGAIPSSYRLILPPGWVRIPLREGTADALESLLFSRLKELPPQVPKDEGMTYRLKVRRIVDEQVAEARKANGLDLYLSVTQRYVRPTAASFLVTEVSTPGSSEDEGPEVILSRLAAADADGAVTETMELDGTLALRREYVRPEAPERQVPLPSRHVDYALAIPHDPRRYLAVAFSTVGDGDPGSEFTGALVELFDALMTTFRWRGADDEQLES